jgi:heat shock protein HslJ
MYTLMKRIIPFLFVLVSACAGAAASRDSAVFANVEGADWVLTEVRSFSGTLLMDRQKMEANNLGEAYTLRFDSGRLTGQGAPNRFNGPYTAGEGRSLSIGPAAATQMMSLVQPEGLTEHEFFTYLAKVTAWDLREGRLELKSASENGEISLVFSLR